MNIFDNFYSNNSNIELLSLHIPKTAGTSFRNILKTVYGEKSVLRVDIPVLNEKAFFDTKHSPPQKLHRRVKVIHGHFNVSKAVQTFNIPDNIPIITWVRDPVERVISNYFYLCKILHQSIDKEMKDLKVVSRMQKTLLEYAKAERNRMSEFIGNLPLKNFFFIGIQEHFTEDLSNLSAMLNWSKYPDFFHNTSEKDKEPVGNDIRAEIKMLNKKDVKLYENALKLREYRQDRLKSH